MPTYHACGVRMHLATLPLSKATTPKVVSRRGDVAARQAEQAANKLRVSANNAMKEKTVAFPGDDDGFGVNWLGSAPVLMVQTGSDLSGKTEDGSTTLGPRALVLHINLSERTFANGLNETDTTHLKIDVLFNGQLTSCVLLRRHDISDGNKSFHEVFAGTRIDYLVERPWVILPPGLNANGSLRTKKTTVDAQGRWDQVCTALMEEVGLRGVNEAGQRPPTAQYLRQLACMRKPTQVNDMQIPGGRQFGVIDVIITAGAGKKTNGSVPYLKTPMRLMDDRYDFAAVSGDGDATRTSAMDQRGDMNMPGEQESHILGRDAERESDPEFEPVSSASTLQQSLQPAEPSLSLPPRPHFRNPFTPRPQIPLTRPLRLLSPGPQSPFSNTASRHNFTFQFSDLASNRLSNCGFTDLNHQSNQVHRRGPEWVSTLTSDPVSSSQHIDVPMNHYFNDRFANSAKMNDILSPKTSSVPAFFPRSPLEQLTLSANPQGDSRFTGFVNEASTEHSPPQKRRRQNTPKLTSDASQLQGCIPQDFYSLPHTEMQSHQDPQHGGRMVNPYQLTFSNPMLSFEAPSSLMELETVEESGAMLSPPPNVSGHLDGHHGVSHNPRYQFHAWLDDMPNAISSDNQIGYSPLTGSIPLSHDRRVSSGIAAKSTSFSPNEPLNGISSEFPKPHPSDVTSDGMDTSSFRQSGFGHIERVFQIDGSLNMHPFNQLPPGPPPAIGYFSATTKPKTSSPPKFLLNLSPMNSSQDQSSILVRRLVITGLYDEIILDHKWSPPRRIAAKARDESGAPPHNRLHSRTRRESPGSAEYVTSKATTVATAGNRRRSKGAAHWTPPPTSPSKEIVPFLTDKVKHDSIHDNITLRHTADRTSSDDLEDQKVDIEEFKPALPDQNPRFNRISGIQGPETSLFFFDDPERLLKSQGKSRSCSLKRVDTVHTRRASRKPAATPKNPDSLDVSSSSSLSSVPSSPDPAKQPKQRISPMEAEKGSRTKSRAFVSKPLSLKQERVPFGRSLPRQPRSPDRLRTTDNPLLNQDCVIAYAESTSNDKDVLRQVKSERQGNFHEESVVVGMRFFIPG